MVRQTVAQHETNGGNVPCGCQGTEPKRIPCPTCRGTGRGSLGGRDGCKRCHGLKTAYDHSTRVPCRACHGTYTDAADEDRCDYLPAAIVATLPISVYRANRLNSWNESNLGLGCVYSCTDYGRANESTDADVIAKVAGEVGDPVRARYRSPETSEVGLGISADFPSSLGVC